MPDDPSGADVDPPESTDAMAGSHETVQSGGSTGAGAAAATSGRHARPTGRVRGWAGEYGWLVSALGVAAAVLLLSLPLLARVGMTWNAGDPAAATARPAPPPEIPITGPAPTPSPTPIAPSPTRRSPRPAQPKPSPTPGRQVVDAAPVRLGPDGGFGLHDMLRGYCREQYPGTNVDAGLRSGLDPATDNWECNISGVRDDPLIAMDKACRWRYGPGSYASYSDPHNALSWRCYRKS